MALGLGSLPNETLALILGYFCAHCSKAHDPDNFPDDHLRLAEPQHDEDDEHDEPEDSDKEPLWYSRTYCNTLYSMCLVSKRLQPVAQSVLYHEFVPGYGDPQHLHRISWGRRLSPFVRTIAARPDLAAVVKRAFVHFYVLRPVTEKEAQATLDEVIGPTASEYLALFQSKRRRRCNIPGLQLLGVLLALTPNLERLSLQVDRSCRDLPASALSTLASLLQSQPLSKLRTLDIGTSSHIFSLEHHAKNILEAVGSALETLNLHKCSTTKLRLQKQLPNISAIRITHGQLGPEDLALLIQSCTAPSLKSFLYETVNPWEDVEYCEFSGGSKFLQFCAVSFHHNRPYPTDAQLTVGGEDHDTYHFQPSEAIRHLRLHKTTLESLHLDLRGIGRPPTPYAGDERPLSETLRDFPSLRHVLISVSMLCNHRGMASYTTDDSMLLTTLLPSTITSLHLAGTLGADTPRLARALLHLAKLAGEEFKALRRVRCDTLLARDGLADYEIEEAFAASDVGFGFDSLPLSELPSSELTLSELPWSEGKRGFRSKALWPLDWDTWCPFFDEPDDF